MTRYLHDCLLTITPFSGPAQFWAGESGHGNSEVIARALEKPRSSRQLLEGQANAMAEPGDLGRWG